MSNERLCVQRCLSGGLITNYYCTSTCAHCLYRCSPRWPHDYISDECARANLLTIGGLGCDSIHIGGGEPLLSPERLIAILGIARDCGIAVQYVETNSSWFRDADSACEILNGLQKAGLARLLVSMSPFHNEFIPFAKVKGVLAACSRSGLSVLPWIGDFYDDLERLDENATHTLAEYTEQFGDGYVEQLPGRYWISNGGRALQTFSHSTRKRTVPYLVNQSRKGCSELGDSSHFHIDLYGNFVPGLCAGLSIARDDLGQPLEPSRYPVLTALHTKGVGGLLAYAMDEFGFEVPRPLFGSKCELCDEIRRFLVTERDQNTPELQPRWHYLE